MHLKHHSREAELSLIHEKQSKDGFKRLHVHRVLLRAIFHIPESPSSGSEWCDIPFTNATRFLNNALLGNLKAADQSVSQRLEAENKLRYRNVILKFKKSGHWPLQVLEKFIEISFKSSNDIWKIDALLYEGNMKKAFLSRVRSEVSR